MRKHRRRSHRDAMASGVGGENDLQAPAYTIDELAAAAGLPSRTVRHYQSVGALQRPERNGRIGVYRQAHLDRLRLIAQLQDRGLRLRAIRDALRQAERRRVSLEEWLGIGEQLRLPWAHEVALTLNESDLRQHLGERPPGFIGRLERAGFLRRQRDRLNPTFVVRGPGLLDIGLKLHDAGVEIETAGEAAALIRKRMRRAAAEVVKYFAQRRGRRFARGRSAADIGQALTALRSLGAEAVRLVFEQEMERALRIAMEKGAIPVPQLERPPEKNNGSA